MVTEYDCEYDVLFDDETNRYGIYRLVEGRPVRICETSKGGIGAALVQLADDRTDETGYEAEVLGILDRLERKWVTSLWSPKR